MSEWECEFGVFHIFDPENVDICFECRVVHFRCANCERDIAIMPLEECPVETKRLMAEVALAEGNDNGGSLSA